MGVINVSVDARKMDDVTRLLADVKNGVPKALVGAINDTSRNQVTAISKAIRERVNIKKRDIDPHIRRTMATPAKMSGTITLSESKRLGLKYFGSKYLRKKDKINLKGSLESIHRAMGGVSYQINRKQSRKIVPGSFIGNKRLGEQVYKREGRKLIKLRGPSPWGVFVIAGLRKKTVTDTNALLEKNLDRRVNFLILKHSGAIK